MTAKCNLNIAGVTKPVDMIIKVSMPDKSHINVAGAQTLKMTDYAVEPPVALFGTIKTGDEITINFKTDFSIQSQ